MTTYTNAPVRERLMELLAYDQMTGVFTWKVNRNSRGGQVQPGDVAGTHPKDGDYIRICIDGTYYAAHRLAVYYVTGKWPTADVDHKDHNRQNNRFLNLRPGTRSFNNENQVQAKSDNRHSVLLGAHWNRFRNKWQSSIQVNKKQKYLGLFDTDLAAHNAYVTAKRAMHAGGTL